MGEVTPQGWLGLAALFIPLLWLNLRLFGWMGLLQIAIMVAVGGWIATVSPQTGGPAIGAVALGAAWLLTVGPLCLWRLIRSRRRVRVLRDEPAPKKSITFLD
jgi:hypothetical protein